MEDIVLVGPLAHPALRTALGIAGGQDLTLTGRLVGGRWAGIRAGGWPRVVDGEEPLAAVRVRATAKLERYAAVMGLAPVDVPGLHLPGVQVLGVATGDANGEEDGHEKDGHENDGAWQADLAAAIAGHIATQPEGRSPDRIAARLPMIAGWCASRLRGRDRPRRRDGLDYRSLAVTEPYAAWFAMEEHDFQPRLHAGGWADPVHRGVFVSGDAAVVLPWDPVRDRVMVVEQFRAGPAARLDPDPFVLEPIAGRIDAGEGPEETMLREAVEEAGVTIRELIPAPHHYPTPGIAAEYIYAYVGIADLPDGCAGIGGLPEEGEDIRGILMTREELTQAALTGRIVNGPLLILALWLDREAGALRARHPAAAG